MAKRKETTKKESKPSIKWNIPDTIITRFASNMVVQIVEGYFKLSFFEIKPDIHLTIPKILPTEIVADCVGSFIVPPDKIPAFLDVLMRQFQQYQTIQKQLSIETNSEAEQSTS